MPIAKITGQGLASMAVVVGLLWTCVIGQRVTLERARSDAADTVRAMRSLRKKVQHPPVDVPARTPQPARRTRLG